MAVSLKLPVAGSTPPPSGSHRWRRWRQCYRKTLLCVIRDAKPKTLTELAALSGRQVPNLSRTLRMMEGYGLVELKRNAREIEPIARATDFLVVLDSPQGEQE